MQKRLVLPVLALVVVLGGVFALRELTRGSDHGIAAGASAAVDSEADRDAPLGGSAELAAPELSDPLRPPADRGGAEGSERVVARETAPATTEPLRTLRGRIVFPNGAPPDPTLKVVARPIEGDEGRLDLSEINEDNIELLFTPRERSGVVAEQSVDPGGTFALEIPSERGVRVELDGRYLYSTPAEVPAAGEEEEREALPELVIEGELGAWVVGRCSPPVGRSAEDSGLVGALAVLNGFSMSGGGAVRRHDEVSEDLEFELRALPPNKMYTLSVDPKLVAAEQLPFFQVSPGQKRDVEFQFLIGATVRGRAVDEAGLPVVGATVQGTTSGDGFGPFTTVQRTSKTDEDGAFELIGLAPGDVQLVAEAEGLTQVEQAVEGLEDQRVRESVELVLKAGVTLHGRLLWPDETPAVGAEVLAPDLRRSLESLSPMASMTRQTPRRAVTDQEGRFRFPGLKEKQKLPIFATATAEDGAEWHLNTKGLLPGTEPHELVLLPPLQVAGRVVDDAGEPVTSGSISILPIPSAVQQKLDVVEFEDAEGRIELSLWKGTFNLTVKSEGYVTETEKLEIPGEIEIVLTREARITGVVLDPGGRPVEGATVHAHDAGKDQSFLFGMPDTGGEKTDAGGRFTVTELEPGRKSVFAEAKGFAPSAPVEVLLEPGAASDELELYLRPPGRVTGVIFDNDGEPDSGRTIMLSEGTQFGMLGESATSDAAGRFAFEDLAEGTYTVMAQPNMEAMLSGSREDDGRSEAQMQADMLSQLKMESCEVRIGETTEVILGEPPAAPVVVSGRVTSAGEPQVEVMVLALAEGENSLLASLKPSVTDADGRYEVTVSEPGNFVFMVRHEDLNEGVTFYESVPATDRYDLDLALPRGGIRGRVIGADGLPFVGARVRISRDGGNLDLSELDGDTEGTGEDGTFSFGMLQAGTYRLRASDSSRKMGGTSLGGIVVEADAVTEGIELQLGGAGVLEVLVRDESGVEVSGADVFLRDASGALVDEVSRMATSAGGVAKMQGLSPGRYTAYARGDGSASEGVEVDVTEGGEARVELDLGPAAWFVISTVDEEGEPVRAQVEITDPSGHAVQRMVGMNAMQEAMLSGFSTTTRRFGPLPLGRYRIQATTDDGRMAKTSKTLREGGDERKVKLRLK